MSSSPSPSPRNPEEPAAQHEREEAVDGGEPHVVFIVPNDNAEGEGGGVDEDSPSAHRPLTRTTSGRRGSRRRSSSSKEFAKKIVQDALGKDQEEEHTTGPSSSCDYTYFLALYLGLHVIGLAFAAAAVGTSYYYYKGDYQEINRSTGQSQTLNDAEVAYSLWEVCVKQNLGGSGLRSNAVCLSRVDGSSNERITGHMQAARVLVTIPLGSIVLGIGFSLLHFLGATRRVSFLILPAIVSAIVPLAAGAVILRLYTTTEGEGGPLNLPSGVTAAPISAPVDRHGTSMGPSGWLSIIAGLIMMWTILLAVAVKLAYPENTDKIERPALQGTDNDPYEVYVPKANDNDNLQPSQQAEGKNEDDTETPHNFQFEQNTHHHQQENDPFADPATTDKDGEDGSGGFAAWGDDGVAHLALTRTESGSNLRRSSSASSGAALQRRRSSSVAALETATSLEERRVLSRRASRHRQLQERLARVESNKQRRSSVRSSRRSSSAAIAQSESQDGNLWHGLTPPTDGPLLVSEDGSSSRTSSGHPSGKDVPLSLTQRTSFGDPLTLDESVLDDAPTVSNKDNGEEEVTAFFSDGPSSEDDDEQKKKMTNTTAAGQLRLSLPSPAKISVGVEKDESIRVDQ